MERVLSDEEKFRKAEEIYNRRRNVNVTVPTRDLNRSTEKRDLKLFKKMLFQIGICICIYFSVYFIQYSNYYFSSDVIKKVEEILSYDINFNESFNKFNEFIKTNKFFSGIFTFFNNDENKRQLEDTLLDNSVLLENTLIENQVVQDSENQNNISNENVSENTTNNIAQENIVDETSINKDEENNSIDPTLGTGGGEGSSSINSDNQQMNEDAQAIKNDYQITLPLRGIITSRYGEREIEPQFHTGIDIARDTGSEIISAINGTVILVDEQKSYGKVLKIQNKDLITLYAHCDEILVNVGDEINMMQKIAKVGSTGNSTGPHLHFEIIYCGRYVNPELILEFKE